MSFIEKHKILYLNQYGFRMKHSTILTLITLTDKIKQVIDNGEYAIGIYLDLKKAFDTVNHVILLKKLEHYGIRGQANTLISNYVTDRTQYCIVNGRNSSICTGVPQGSVLGPLLFLLYVNDIASSMTDENLILFADDTSVLLHDKNLKSLLDKAKSSLTKIQSWF